MSSGCPAVSSPRVALVLGCGGARGLAHVTVIEALEELGIVPDLVVGCSMGAVVGAAYCSGMEGRAIRRHAAEAFGSRRRVAASVWKARSARMRGGLFDLERLMPSFMPAGIASSFEALKMPLHVVAADMHSAEDVVITEGSLVQALAASASIPAVFLPVIKDGRSLVDGGLANPVPFDHARHHADVVIAVDVGGLPARSGRPPSPAATVYASTQIMQRSLVEARRRTSAPDVLIRPPVGAFGTMDFHRVRQVMAAADSVREVIKSEVAAAVGR